MVIISSDTLINYFDFRYELDEQMVVLQTNARMIGK